MKIVILDAGVENPGDLSWEPLAKLGDLTVYDTTPPELIIPRIGNAQIVCTNKVLLTEAVFDACPDIRMVAVLATGYNVVDLQAARKRGIAVSNVPGYGTDAVAQFTIAMLLEICNRVGLHSDAVHRGEWTENGSWCFWKTPLMDLQGKTMGIIGLGSIGKATARLAAAFGMKVIAHSTHPCPEGAALAEYVSRDELFRRADVIALHCPLTAETRGIINRETIRAMKDGVILLNSARGPLVAEEDLAEALNSGKVYAFAADVVSSEPIQPDNPLLTAKNCYITPHIAWASRDSRQRLMDIAVDNIRAFIAGSPKNTVQ